MTNILFLISLWVIPGTTSSDLIFDSGSHLIVGQVGNYRIFDLEGTSPSIRISNAEDEEIVACFDYKGMLILSQINSERNFNVAVCQPKSGVINSRLEDAAAYSPNYLQGELFVFNLFGLVIQKHTYYSFIAQEAELQNNQFVLKQNLILKCPEAIRNSGFNFKKFWLIEMGDEILVFQQAELSVIRTNMAELLLEKTTNTLEPERKTALLFNVSGGIRPQERFLLKEIWPKKDISIKFEEWFNSITLVNQVWKHNNSIKIAYSHNTKGFNLSQVNLPDMNLVSIYHPGRFLGAHGDFVLSFSKSLAGIEVENTMCP